MGEHQDRLIAGPNPKPSNAPDHPYWEKKYSNEKWHAFGEAMTFFQKLQPKWERLHEQMTPEEVKQEFDAWKAKELEPGRRLKHTREAIQKLTLYDVWASASYKADEQLHTGSTSEPSYATLADRAKVDRLAELIKETHEQFEKPPAPPPAKT